MTTTTGIIDDLNQPPPRASNGAEWTLVADRVMGGVSDGAMRREVVKGREAIRMQGDVSLANNGGFLQIALDLAPGSAAIDASAWSGIEIDVTGNGERYNLHLRTVDVTQPWQSYRASFIATGKWQTVVLPFDDFLPHRIDAPLDLQSLRRIGIVAIGRAFHADIAIAGVRFTARPAGAGRNVFGRQQPAGGGLSGGGPAGASHAEVPSGRSPKATPARVQCVGRAGPVHSARGCWTLSPRPHTVRPTTTSIDRKGGIAHEQHDEWCAGHGPQPRSARGASHLRALRRHHPAVL